MYWILIVDDEYLIRKGLRYAIPWEDMGYKVAEEAASAEEALLKFENLHIDVAIIDINMQGMNGLDLISIIKTRFPHIKTVIISGYEDFNYSVSAIKMEVFDYILKPINKDTIISTFSNLKLKMDEESQKQEVLQARGHASSKLFLQRLLNNDFMNKEEMLEFGSKHGISFPPSACCVIVIRINQLALVVKEQFQNSRHRLEDSLDNILNQAYNQLGLERYHALSVITGDNYAVISTDDEAENLSRLIAEDIISFTSEFKIGIGQTNEDLSYMSVSFLEAIEAIGSCTATDIICKASSNSDRKEMDTSRKVYLNKIVIQKIDEGKYDELNSLVEMIFNELQGNDLNIIFNWCVNSIYSIIEYFSINSFSTKKIISDFDIMVISSDFSIHAIKSSYKEKLNKIRELMKSLHASSAEYIVRKACEIANEEYLNQELSLHDIASRINISYGYLSTVFKQIMGENFSVYLTNIKMNHARKLIMEGQHKIYEIADIVGYSSARYFTDQFRKQFGVSPSDYRARLSESNENQ